MSLNTAQVKSEKSRKIKKEVKEEPIMLEAKWRPESHIKQEIKIVKQENSDISSDFKPFEKAKKELDENGNSYWDLGSNKRATLSVFKGVEYLNIRQYYVDDASGISKPTKKGITLRKTEWDNLKSIQNEIKFSQ